MLKLRRVADGREAAVGSRLRIGRAPDAGLHVPRPFVSLEHATLRWSGAGWALRDLGSRNGTFLDGRPLVAGEEADVDLGSVVAFGDLDEAWAVVEATPPRVCAEPVDGGPPVFGGEGLLALPGPDRPEVSIYQEADGRWVVEREDGERAALEDGDAVVAGGQRWRLVLPSVFEGTPAVQAAPTLSSVSLRFAVSRDEERVVVEVVHRGRTTALEPHWHGYVLLTLARLRADAHQRPEAERGWVERDRLLRMLRMDANNLNVAIHKARAQLLEAGVLGASGVVEVRRGLRRFGTDRFEISRLP